MINVSLGFPVTIFSFAQNTDDVSDLASPNQHSSGANLDEIANSSHGVKVQSVHRRRCFVVTYAVWPMPMGGNSPPSLWLWAVAPAADRQTQANSMAENAGLAKARKNRGPPAVSQSQRTPELTVESRDPRPIARPSARAFQSSFSALECDTLDNP
jgi:hypothetical protein